MTGDCKGTRPRGRDPIVSRLEHAPFPAGKRAPEPPPFRRGVHYERANSSSTFSTARAMSSGLTPGACTSKDV
jgi:hypothetical protein